MIKLKSCFEFLWILPLFTIAGSPLSAQSPHSTVSPVLPSSLNYENQMYETTSSGLRGLLDENIKEQSPEIYIPLDSHLKELERKSKLSSIVTWGSFSLGLGYALLAPKNKRCFIHDLGDPSRCKRYQDDTVENAIAGSSIFLTGGLFAGFFISPNRGEILEFINHHNRLNPKHPIKLQLGINPTNDSINGGLVFHF